jgi:1-acyl-sn-glycerol-3-phosphate acyltransferase
LPSTDPVRHIPGSVLDAIRSWIGTIVFLPVFGLILGVFDVGQRVARLFGQRPQEYVAGALQVTLVYAFRLCGTRIQVERPPRLRPGKAYIIVSNHQSMFDIPILGALLLSHFPKYISKRSLGRWIPSVSYNLRRGGCDCGHSRAWRTGAQRPRFGGDLPRGYARPTRRAG